MKIITAERCRPPYLVCPVLTLLLLLLLRSSNVESETVEATSPGLTLRLSQPGLDYAASVAVDVLSARVRQLSIPDQHGYDDFKIGHVEYDVTNMHVCITLMRCISYSGNILVF